MLRVRDLRHSGFTLVELIVTMVITGIVALLLVNIISVPIEGFSDMKRRAELVDIAEITLHKMSREIRQALPNSIKITQTGTVSAIAFLHTIDGGRYAGSGSNIFTANKNLSEFLITKALSNIDDSMVKSSAYYLVIYNLGQTGADVYQGDNISKITALPLAPNIKIEFDTFSFPFTSPNKRFMIVDEAVSFICDTATGELRLYRGYNFRDDQSGGDSTPTDSSQGYLLANKISACSFKYNPGTITHPALVTLEITISDNKASNETISLLNQIFIENQP